MQLDEQNRLLTERGMVLVGNDDGDEDEDLASDDGKAGAGDQDQRTRAIVSAETAAILTGLGKGPLDVRWGGSFNGRPGFDLQGAGKYFLQ